MANKNSKNLVLFQPGLSESLIGNISKKLKPEQILSASMNLFPGGAEFVEPYPFNKKGFTENGDRMKGSNIIIVQSTGAPCAQNLMFALEAIHNAKGCGAKTVSAIFPYAEYMRQDKPDAQRFSSVANEMIPMLLAAAGLDHVTLVTPHSKEGIKHYTNVFGKNVHCITATEIMAEKIKAKFEGNLHNLMIGAPDGLDKPDDQGHIRAKELAIAIFGEKDYEKHIFGIAKNRTAPGESEIKAFESNVEGKVCLLLDDMVDTGGTMIKGAKKLKEKGATETHIATVHPLFTLGLAPFLSARDIDDNFLIKSLIVANTLPVENKIRDARFQFPNHLEKIDVVDISSLVLKEIERISEKSSVTEWLAKSISRINNQRGIDY